MRKLIVQLIVSVDGRILEKDTEFWSWFWSRPEDEELDEHFVAALRPAGTHIMGRATYEDMAAHWPSSSQPAAPIMNDIPKVVFSTSMTSADWPESRIASGDTAEEIARLKAEAGGEIVAHGGVRFVQSLAQLAVVDEYRLFVAPTVVGAGRSIFETIEGLQPLHLVSSRAFPASGAMALVYAPERAD